MARGASIRILAATIIMVTAGLQLQACATTEQQEAAQMSPEQKVAACSSARQEETSRCGPFPQGTTAATANAKGYDCDNAKSRVAAFCS